jgi:NADH-quinone oxidoreductase subunit M
MGPYIEGQVLSWVLFMPGATALLLLLSGAILRALFGSAGLPGEIWRAIALGSMGLTFLLALWGVAVPFDPETIGVQLAEYGDWLPSIGLQYFLAVDGINLFLVLLTTLMGPLVLLAVWKQAESSVRSLVFFLLVFESAALGVFLSFNLLLFHLFWQSALVSMYFIIGIWGGPRRVFAATKFLLYTGASSMAMWIAILVLFQLNLEATGFPGST